MTESLKRSYNDEDFMDLVHLQLYANSSLPSHEQDQIYAALRERFTETIPDNDDTRAALIQGLYLGLGVSEGSLPSAIYLVASVLGYCSRPTADEMPPEPT